MDSKRRGMLLEAGKRTESVFNDLGHSISYLRDSLAISEALSDYLKLRIEFSKHHGTGDNLLANHKVSALYIWTLINHKARSFFLFSDEMPEKFGRAVQMTFMYFIIYGTLEIDFHEMDESIQKDLEYCLLNELPSNLEWLCLTMHAICRYRGSATNIDK